MENLAHIVPRHIAIIPDGNRRWAKEKGFPSLLGHKKGFERTLEIVLHAQKMGVETITFYAFSTENWNRAKDEVDYLMKLFSIAFDRWINRFHRLGIKIRHLGDITPLAEASAKKIKKGIEITKNNPGMVLQLAINYGGRDEIKRALKQLLDKNIKSDEITEDQIAKALDTKSVPDPDLIIRTSGEQRLSNFLPWQAAYSELYFTPTYWPDFSKKEFDKAVAEYSQRQRRFGS
ncbi:MAG TPA: polyprenyl diphosphate synthase [bacterium]|nr:polyprenyl diphosphate synthase [bacterium]